MKKIVIAFSIAAVSSAVAISSPIRSMLGADSVREIGEIPTAADYISDSLVAMWDGIENAGWGLHDDTLNKSTWVELMGTGWKLDTARNSYFLDDALVQNARDMGYSACSSALKKMFASTYTLEVVLGEQVYFDSTDNNHESIGGIFGTNPRRFIPYIRCSDMRVSNSDIGGVTYVPNKCPYLVLQMDRENLEGTCFLYVEGMLIYEWHIALTEATPTVNYFYLQAWIHKLHAVRMHTRILTPEEIHYNYLIDRERFGLP